MKITKLIVPIMALTTLNNTNNNQAATAIRLEKEINMPYEVLARDNWDNYLINDNTAENQLNNQNVLMTPIVHADGCEALLTSMLAGCARYWYNPAWKATCIAAAWASYWACNSA